MFAKFITVVLALGLIGCAVLASRQARLQAASELAQAQLRVAAADDALTNLRARVAHAVAPFEVERVAAAAGPLRPATNDIPRSLLAKELKGLTPDPTAPIRERREAAAPLRDSTARPRRVASRPD